MNNVARLVSINRPAIQETHNGPCVCTVAVKLLVIRMQNVLYIGCCYEITTSIHPAADPSTTAGHWPPQMNQILPIITKSAETASRLNRTRKDGWKFTLRPLHDSPNDPLSYFA